MPWEWCSMKGTVLEEKKKSIKNEKAMKSAKEALKKVSAPVLDITGFK